MRHEPGERGVAIPRRYRVEHRDGETVALLGRVLDVFPHPSTLAPWLAPARRAGWGGELLLVEEATGRVVARRRVTLG